MRLDLLTSIVFVFLVREKKSSGRLSYQRYAVINDRCSIQMEERRTNVSLLTEEFQQMERKTKEVR